MEQRFLSKVNKTDTCWIWIGYKKNVKGYGGFDIGHRSIGAHRVAYELWKGDIPTGLIVRHLCNNPSCVNPEHLEVGTHRDNTNDKLKAGREAKGSSNGKTKLTILQVEEIKKRIDIGHTNREIALDYNITRQTIYAIRKGITWKGV